MKYSLQNCVCEWPLSSGRTYDDPFNEVEVDVIVSDPEGDEQRVPAFWAGDQTWRVRYSSPKIGTHRYRSVCTDESNSDLHGRDGAIEVTPYDGSNPLLQHGPLCVASDGRHLDYYDGTPFFWLGDTWWMGLCKRLQFPGEFQTLIADRVSKGFTVIQIVAGLYPDMDQFDERGANEAGFPWTTDYSRINPCYFEMADLRIDRLVQAGLVPCVVGCWGYFLPWMGVEKVRQHWRNLIARYGAYPVVWCLAGEGVMPYYLSETKEQDSAFQKKGWTELGRYVREIDPYHRLVTIHPGDSARNTIEDPSVLDFDMLQTGHGDRGCIPNTIRLVTASRAQDPKMPVINGEVCYEGIGEACRQEVQRFMFWSCLLSGAAGHTYGANGIWQVNRRERPYGPSPHGMAWGNVPWEDASQLPGSTHLGIGKRLLEAYQWWKFEPHPEWVEPHWTEENYQAPYAAGIHGEVRVVFLPWYHPNVTLKGLEQDVSYRAFLFNPVNGEEHDLGTASPDAGGEWKMPRSTLPVFQDWVLVLERLG